MQPLVQTLECQGASVGRVMGVGAGRVNIGGGNELQDLRGAQFGNSAVEIEWVMVSLESFGSAEGAMTFGDVVVGHSGGTKRFGFGAGMGVPHCLNAHGGRAEVKVIEGRVRSIFLFNFIHVLG